MCRILIIDDEPHIVKLLELKFKLVGYDVLSATSGEEGLRLAREYAPNLIVLDVMMPNLDGFAVAQQLKADAQTQAIPIVFLTARTSEADEAQGMSLGAAAYVRKPFRPSQLLALVEEHITSPHCA